MEPILDQELLAAIEEDRAVRNQDFITSGLGRGPRIINPAQTVGTGALDAILQTTNAITGSNFNTQGIQNTNQQIASLDGQARQLAGAENELLKQEIGIQSQAQKAQAQAAKDDARARKDELDLQIKLEKERRAQEKADRDARIAEARIGKIQADTQKALRPQAPRQVQRTTSSTTTNTTQPTPSNGQPQDNRNFDRFLFDLTKSQFSDSGFKDNQIRSFFNKPIQEARKIVAKVDDVGKRARNVVEQLSKGKVNPAAIGGLATTLAKAAGETGVLTDTDIARFKGSQSLFAKIRRFTTEKSTGELPEEDVRQLRELAQSYLDAARNQKSKIAFETASDLSARFGSTPEEILRRGLGRTVRAEEDAEQIISRFTSNSNQNTNQTTDTANDDALIDNLTQGIPAGIAAPAASGDADDALLKQFGI